MKHTPKIYVASAGTGKTTILVQTLKEILEQGAKPEEILFTTFTNAGADELLERTLAAIPGNKYETKQFKWFRTLHSIAYRNIPHKQMMRSRDYQHFGQKSGWPMTGGQVVNTTDGTIKKGALPGDSLLHLVQLMRNKRISANQTAALQTNSSFTSEQICKFEETYRLYRQEIGKYDFTDQLETFLQRIESNKTPFPLSHIIVDEAQDLSGLQWAIIRGLHNITKVPLIIAGDDKQAIYEFSGASPETLIHFDGERTVLNTSYRVPSEILKYTESIAGRILEKQDYKVKSNVTGGSVNRCNHIGNLPLDRGTWFFLVRNRFMMGMVENEIVKRGFVVKSDAYDSIFNPKLLESIRTWNELLKGFECSGKQLQTLSEFLPTRKAVQFGYMKQWNQIHEDEWFNWEELHDNYGLLTKKPWHEIFSISNSARQALLPLEEKGELGSEPRIRISTIHGVKGQEADNVVVYPDISIQTKRSFERNPDTEHRVFYVAVTRARKNLYLHEPFTDHHYEL